MVSEKGRFFCVLRKHTIEDALEAKARLFLNTTLTSEQENAGTCIKQVSVHNSTSKVFAVRAAWISSTISSAERLSFHTPAKRFAQPLRGLVAGSSECVIELLSKVMSSTESL